MFMRGIKFLTGSSFYLVEISILEELEMGTIRNINRSCGIPGSQNNASGPWKDILENLRKGDRINSLFFNF